MRRLVLIFLVFVGLEVSESQINNVTSAMVKDEIIPDVVTESPGQELKVEYGNVTVSLGNELTPTQTKDEPNLINWKADENKYYTLIFTAPDGPSRAKPKFREVIKWLVVNIPGNNIKKGKILAEYIGAGPSKNAGLARYAFFIYKQKGKQKFDEKRISNHDFDSRKHFSTRKFAEKYRMNLKAANFFQARYDDYVPVLYKQLNYHEDS